MSEDLRRYRCGECGYGASVRRVPERCPMCGASAWMEQPERAPAFLAEDLVEAARRAALDADAPLARERSVFPGVPFS